MTQSDALYLKKFAQAASAASADVRSMSLPDTIDIYPNAFADLGPKLAREAQAVFVNMTIDHGKNFPLLMMFSLKLAWFSVCLDIRWNEFFGGETENREPRIIPLTPELYVNTRGWNWTLLHLLFSIDAVPRSILESFEPTSVKLNLEFTWYDVLTCMSLHFFSKAASNIRAGLIADALNWTYEASDALATEQLARASMEREAAEQKNRNGASDFAMLGANAKNAENRAMKKQAFDWCDENMENFNSIDSAAEHVSAKILPVKFRTAQKYISSWRKIQRAGEV